MTLRLPAVLLVLFLAAPLDAQHYQTDFPAEEFRARHARVFEQIGANAVAVVQGVPQTEGFTLPRQHNTFYYLSGIETPGAYLLLDGRTKRVTIYLPPRNPRLEAAEGRVLSAEDVELVKRITGVDDVKPLADMIGTSWPLVLDSGDGRRSGRRGGRGPRPRSTRSSARPRTSGQSRGELVAAETARANDFWDGAPSRQRRFVELLRSRHPRVGGAEPEPDPRRDAQHQERARDRDDPPRVANRRPRADGSHAQHGARRDRVPARCRGALRVPRQRRAARGVSVDHRQRARRTSTTCTISATRPR